MENLVEKFIRCASEAELRVGDSQIEKCYAVFTWTNGRNSITLSIPYSESTEVPGKKEDKLLLILLRIDNAKISDSISRVEDAVRFVKGLVGNHTWKAQLNDSPTKESDSFETFAKEEGLELPTCNLDNYMNPTWRWEVPRRPIVLTVSEWRSTVSIVVESYGETSRIYHSKSKAVALIKAIVGQGGWDRK